MNEVALYYNKVLNIIFLIISFYVVCIFIIIRIAFVWNQVAKNKCNSYKLLIFSICLSFQRFVLEYYKNISSLSALMSSTSVVPGRGRRTKAATATTIIRNPFVSSLCLCRWFVVRVHIDALPLCFCLLTARHN
jgi:hypothetical protein